MGRAAAGRGAATNAEQLELRSAVSWREHRASSRARRSRSRPADSASTCVSRSGANWKQRHVIERQLRRDGLDFVVQAEDERAGDSEYQRRRE